MKGYGIMFFVICNTKRELRSWLSPYHHSVICNLSFIIQIQFWKRIRTHWNVLCMRDRQCRPYNDAFTSIRSLGGAVTSLRDRALP